MQLVIVVVHLYLVVFNTTWRTLSELSLSRLNYAYNQLNKVVLVSARARIPVKFPQNRHKSLVWLVQGHNIHSTNIHCTYNTIHNTI